MTIETKWDEFRRLFVPTGPPEQAEAARTAFYAGALASLEEFVRIGAAATDEAECVRDITALFAEMDAFVRARVETLLQDFMRRGGRAN